MMASSKTFAAFACFLGFSFAALAGDTTKAKPVTIPHLEKRGKATQLIVNGQPFLILGGELHNSSASSTTFMQPVWKRLSSINMNTVLASVSWELVEPEEGKFDFSLVNDLIKDARKNNMKLSLLWFGSWKNGLSHYTPAWVKKDYKRFPRMRLKNKLPVEAITPFSEDAMNADAKAFAALMKYIKKTDEAQQTVILIQVQNEVGLIGESRDHSEAANKFYSQPVPTELIGHMQKNKETLLPEYRQLWAAQGFQTTGTWTEVFGNTASSEEAFMAWQYARYINKVAEAGKAQYPLPMFVNAWIVQPEDLKPGDYPSGGPQSHLLDIWRAAAPAVDLFSPDIYLPNFDEVAASYTRSGNVLFVPESRGDAQGAANAFYAIGQHNAIGYSPFGIDNRVEDPANAPLSKAYAILQQLTPKILIAQSKGSIAGIWLNPKKKKQQVELGGYHLDIVLRNSLWRTETSPENGYGLVIADGPDEFIIAGKDIQFNFFPPSGGTGYIGIASIDEGAYVNGKWVAGRRLNGDDIMYNYKIAEEIALQKNGTVVRLTGDGPKVLRVKLYRYE
ncbi:MAG: DUF5597 domain-containing protein [Ferruginibacter sp.]|nr:DUF5597 domain-containing protein [Ferruginibacter sp.]